LSTECFGSAKRTVVRAGLLVAMLLAAASCLLTMSTGRADAADATSPPTTAGPAIGSVPSLSITTPTVPAPGTPGTPGSVSIDLGGALTKPSESITIIVALTLLSVAPALLMMVTSFTRIVIVLSLTRNGMGLQTIPPNQVVVGLALFLSLFVMSPTINQVNQQAVQPYLNGRITQGQAYKAAQPPLRSFMLKQTRKSELAVFENQPGQVKPKTDNDIPLATLIPAFILSEIKTAFIIGFVIFIPFLVIDLIVSSSLMSMGMMMLPPVLVSLPFKILLFVLVDGWGLVVTSLLKSFR
jgi:flagellar biosynthetic protein FliP